MEPQIENQTPQVSEISSIHKVTPVSKYLAMVLFVIMPFLGGWIGYTYAPEKIVEITVPILENSDELNSANDVSSPSVSTENSVSNILTTSEPYFGLPLSVTSVVETPISISDLDSQDTSQSRIMEGDYRWGSGPPVISVKQTTLSVTEDPNCDYACVPTKIARLDYYTYDSNSEPTIFYTEELDISNIRKVDYIILGFVSGEKFTFIQSINKSYCCDDGGKISNRLFDVNLKENKTIVRENLDV